MSWKEGVLSVVEEMEKMVAEACASKQVLMGAVTGWAKQLTLICKVAPDHAPSQSLIPKEQLNALLLTPSTQHAVEIEKARAEFRKTKHETLAEERFTGDGVEVIGGPVNPDGEATVTEQVNPEMPMGAYMTLAGAVYQLRKIDNTRKLVYDEVQTKAVIEQLKKEQENG